MYFYFYLFFFFVLRFKMAKTCIYKLDTVRQSLLDYTPRIVCFLIRHILPLDRISHFKIFDIDLHFAYSNIYNPK